MNRMTALKDVKGEKEFSSLVDPLTLQEQELSSALWALPGSALQQTERWLLLPPPRPSAAVSECTWRAAGCRTPEDTRGSRVGFTTHQIAALPRSSSILPSPALPGLHSGQTEAAGRSSAAWFPRTWCRRRSPPGSSGWWRRAWPCSARTRPGCDPGGWPP